MQHYVVDSRTCLMEEQRSLWEFVPTWYKKGIKVEEPELTYEEHKRAKYDKYDSMIYYGRQCGKRQSQTMAKEFYKAVSSAIAETKQKESGMTHAKEIKRWADCPDDTRVWVKQKDGRWAKLSTVTWSKINTFIVDDEYAELRKAHADGKEIEVMTHIGWVDAKINPEWKDKASSYRIKPKPKVAKMTMEQVIKELGYEVEITK